ncbi:hypothetical protein DV702_12010 [Sporosarcina sp. PTS2304]|uniref:hypothetical protein n=1 Tax=Sporosarcina sp. PTS2304 TaxID=2283194 RepID=UPI000E0CFCAD|nr:hypothetical protein DV702_12010 [Sporosarcina sp. PTS2304]
MKRAASWNSPIRFVDKTIVNQLHKLSLARSSLKEMTEFRRIDDFFKLVRV